MQKITTFLTFAESAEQAAKFYVSIFKPSKIVKTTRYGKAGPGAKGSVMTVQFKLAGEENSPWARRCRSTARPRKRSTPTPGN
jgi:predicted 3-demethylubiquinone-9 3-methyltransferase (glyoxalase superfamily)